MAEPPPPPLDMCEEVGWHSKQKHAFIEAYFHIWTERVRTSQPSLDIVDLNAGWGWCYDPEANRHPWEGTAVLSARCLRDYQTPRGKRLVINSFSPEGSEKQAKQRMAVEEAVKAFQTPPENFSVHLMTEPVEAAVERAKQLVRREYPTIWLLDPYRTDDLPWETVQNILNF